MRRVRQARLTPFNPGMIETQFGLRDCLNSPQVRSVHLISKAGEDHLLNRIASLQLHDGFPHRNLDRQIDREPVDPATDGWKRQRAQMMLPRNLKAGSIATRQQFPLTLVSPVPHRPDSMDHKSRRKPIALRKLRLPSLATAQQAALAHKFRPGSAMDCPVNPSTAQQ